MCRRRTYVRKNFPSLSAQPDLTAMRAWNENPEERTLLSFLVATCISLQGTKEPTLHQIIILTVMNRKISLLSLLGLSVFVLCYIQNTQAIPQQYSQGKCFSQFLLSTQKHLQNCTNELITDQCSHHLPSVTSMTFTRRWWWHLLIRDHLLSFK